MSELWKGGFGKMVQDAAVEWSEVLVGSAAGDDAGTMFSSVLGSALSSAAFFAPEKSAFSLFPVDCPREARFAAGGGGEETCIP